jgi:hypothetical protein
LKQEEEEVMSSEGFLKQIVARFHSIQSDLEDFIASRPISKNSFNRIEETVLTSIARLIHLYKHTPEGLEKQCLFVAIAGARDSIFLNINKHIRTYDPVRTAPIDPSDYGRFQLEYDAYDEKVKRELIKGLARLWTEEIVIQFQEAINFLRVWRYIYIGGLSAGVMLLGSSMVLFNIALMRRKEQLDTQRFNYFTKSVVAMDRSTAIHGDQNRVTNDPSTATHTTEVLNSKPIASVTGSASSGIWGFLGRILLGK